MSEWRMIFQMATTKMNWRMIELYVEISSIGNVGDSLNNLPGSSNRTENIIPSIINLAHQIHESDPQRFIYSTPISPNVTDEWEQNDESDDVRNEDNDVLEEEKRNDDDFVLILPDGWEIGEDYWDSADEDDDPDYDPHEHIERQLIVKNRSEKYHPVRDFSDISKINEINAPSQSQFDNPLSENQTFNSKEQL
jgi:hypothetical protein